jgi:hypothetical protein
MNLWRWAAIGAVCIAALTVSACDHTTQGVAVGRSTAPVTATARPSPRSTFPTATATNQAPPFGVVPTTRAPIPAQTVTCSPPVRPGVLIVAKVADPQAPKVTVPVPGGWNLARGSGDVAARMNGPDGMKATVTIAATKLDAAEAFREYADQMTAKYAISALSFVPAEMCDYSGQKLMGTLSNSSTDAIQFNDHIVHVWTNTKDYLVAVHVEAPTGVADLDTISEPLMGDFEIRIP